MARRVISELEPDDIGASREFRESHRATLPSSINSSTKCRVSQSGYQRRPQASILPRRDDLPPQHRTSHATPSGLRREQINRPVSSYATREVNSNPEPRRRLQAEPDLWQLPARERSTEMGSSCRRPSKSYGGPVRQLSGDYNVVYHEPDGYERSPHRGGSKPRHRSNRSQDRKYRQPTGRLRGVLTRDTSKKYASRAEKRYPQPQLADRIPSPSHYDWSKDACRISDRSIHHGVRGKMRNRPKHWEMFDNDQKRWIVPNGDRPRYVEGRRAWGARHQIEPADIRGRQESRRKAHEVIRQSSADGIERKGAWKWFSRVLVL